jgi:DNA-binding FrmR family transcriptional regulator
MVQSATLLPVGGGCHCATILESDFALSLLEGASAVFGVSALFEGMRIYFRKVWGSPLILHQGAIARSNNPPAAILSVATGGREWRWTGLLELNVIYPMGYNGRLHPSDKPSLTPMPHLADPDRKKALCARLARVEGQLRGVQRLIDSDADCEKIAQQLAAARKALDKSFFAMVGCMIEQEGLPGDHVAQMLVKFA